MKDKSFYLMDHEELDKRPHQTGMEVKWEKWILNIINILNSAGIPVYDSRRQAMDPPDRLAMIVGRMHNAMVENARLRSNLDGVRLQRETIQLQKEKLEQLVMDVYKNFDDETDHAKTLLKTYLKETFPRESWEEEDYD